MSSFGSKLGSVIGWWIRVFGWLLLGSVLYGVFLYVFFVYGIERTVGRRADYLRSHLWQLRSEIRGAEATSARLTEFTRVEEEKREQLERLERVLPGEARLEALEAQILETAASRRVDLVGFAAGQTEERDFYVRIPLELEAHGGFDALSVFVKDLGEFERLLLLRGVRLDRDGSLFSAKLRLDAYHFPAR